MSRATTWAGLTWQQPELSRQGENLTEGVLLVTCPCLREAKNPVPTLNTLWI